MIRNENEISQKKKRSNQTLCEASGTFDFIMENFVLVWIEFLYKKIHPQPF